MKQSGIERHGARDEAKRNRAARRKRWSKAESSGTAQEMEQSGIEQHGARDEAKRNRAAYSEQWMPRSNSQ